MQNKSDYERELRNQISIIKNTVEQMKGRATYGSFEKFLKHLSTIDQAASKMAEQMNGKFFVSIQKYKKILVPYDGSKYSKEALNEASEIAKKFGSTLYLLMIVDVSAVKPPGMLLGIMIEKRLKKWSTQLLESVKSKADKMLESEMQSCRKMGVETYYEIQTGNAVDSILKFANRQEIGLIIIGSRGLSGIGKIMALGSVSRKISEEANCPVMIVR
ncbi:MAG TPA: universal stress protein [Nitrosopumilaceae archaeon]|nr:universal stress protein [Nitrosopumilaceae archaeon]